MPDTNVKVSKLDIIKSAMNKSTTGVERGFDVAMKANQKEMINVKRAEVASNIFVSSDDNDGSDE